MDHSDREYVSAAINFFWAMAPPHPNPSMNDPLRSSIPQ